MTEEELNRLRDQARSDRKLIQKAAEALAEIDRNHGLIDPHIEVLTALRIRVEGKERASLDELLTTTGDISGKKDLGDALGSKKSESDWPTIEEKKKDWPT
ncbi:MAG TPA: hypothetical protein VEV82_10280 [Actinomycetota bacterium]|nr:hypothetical protein [Actinomycetota bacterium]